MTSRLRLGAETPGRSTMSHSPSEGLSRTVDRNARFRITTSLRKPIFVRRTAYHNDGNNGYRYGGDDYWNRCFESGVGRFCRQGARAVLVSEPRRVGAIRRLGKRLAKLGPKLVVFEASGGYEGLAVSIFIPTHRDLPTAVIYPKRVRQFAAGLGVMAKTDAIDARMIAYYARVAKIQPIPPHSGESRHVGST